MLLFFIPSETPEVRYVKLGSTLMFVIFGGGLAFLLFARWQHDRAVHLVRVTVGRLMPGLADKMAETGSSEIKRFLGVGQGYGQGLGIDDKFAYNIIKQVGNYGESFDRNVGKGSPLKLERGLNDLWTRGGLMYAIPFR